MRDYRKEYWTEQEDSAEYVAKDTSKWPGKRSLTENLYRWPSSVQLKRAVGASSDPAEHEADAIADHVAGRSDGASFDGLGDGLSGAPLPGALRRELEPALGRDLSSVRLHTDGEAAAQANALGARAYAAGDDIGFAAGALQPGVEGKRLLVHEVVHTAQQAGADAPIRRELTSPRFIDVAQLTKIDQRDVSLKKGDKGPGIQRIRQALVDLAVLGSVSELFDDATEDAVKVYQGRKNLPETGTVDKTTLLSMDKVFASKVQYAKRAQEASANLDENEDIEWPEDGKQWSSAHPPDELMSGARDLSAQEAKDAQSALSMKKVDPKVGKIDKFRPMYGKNSYEQALTAVLDEEILSQHKTVAEGKKEQHDDPNNLHSLETFATVGESSKASVDAVFGSYRTGKAYEADVSLKDKFAVEEQKIANKNADQTLETAKWRITKMLRSNVVEKVNRQHNVDPNRATEAEIIARVQDKLAAKYKKELLETQMAWPASADAAKGVVLVQLFKKPEAAENRKQMWQIFGRLMHEYMHTLEHSDWTEYKKKAQTDKKGVLTEGVTEFLTRVALSRVEYTPQLRKSVEGEYYDATNTQRASRSSYQDETNMCEKMVGVVGVQNVYAAYFLGQVDKIGGYINAK